MVLVDKVEKDLSEIVNVHQIFTQNIYTCSFLTWSEIVSTYISINVVKREREAETLTNSHS